MKNQGPQGKIRKLILHFNIDKTIVIRDSLGYNNTDYMIREILSELIWGRVEEKNKEKIFKVEHKTLEFDKANVSPECITYSSFLNEKFKPLSQEEYQTLNQEKPLEDLNREINSNKVKAICEIVETNNPGFKFRRMFEDMRKKLRVDEKIQVDLGLKLDNSKLEEKALLEVVSPKFNELGEEYDRKEKFRRIFKNSYHKIIISFFTMMITLKKNKQDFAVVFRFFGHDAGDIEEFIYEFNCFCECLHPRYCGDYGYNKVKYDPEKEKKDYRINLETQHFMGVSYRSIPQANEKLFFETIDHPPMNEIEEHRENIDDYYFDDNKNKGKLSKGYNEIYLTLMEKLTQNCTFVLLDDYSFYQSNQNKHGKLFLIDPYDEDTLQIMFDTDTDEFPEKVDVIDVITQKKLDNAYIANKFLVNVEPYRAILDTNYYNNKIEECIENRLSELMKMEGKELPILPLVEGFNFEKEMKKLSSDEYLQMTVLPLLHNALSVCDMIRPQDPITFIANFMLMNKGTVRNLEEILKELPREQGSQDAVAVQGETEEENEEKEGSGDEQNKHLSKQASIQQQQPHQATSQKKTEEVPAVTAKKEEVKLNDTATKMKTKTQGNK